jgi:hypothetical protein
MRTTISVNASTKDRLNKLRGSMMQNGKYRSLDDVIMELIKSYESKGRKAGVMR